MAQWQPGQVFNTQLKDAKTAGMLAYADKYPGATLNLIFVWLQGEFDAGASSTANAYDAALQTFLDDLDTAWGNPTTYIVMVNSGFASCPFASTVRTAETHVASLHAWRHTIDADSITSHDTIHYDKTGQEQLGALIGAAI